MRVLVIVAHPDDETIWSGGLIMQRPEWEWTVLSLCRGDDPDRAPKFKEACKRLGVAGIILDVDDSDPLAPIDPGEEIPERILEAVGEESWDLCLTHGRDGEYGHRRHEEVHAEVVSLVEREMLQAERLWLFAYQCDGMTGECGPAPNADVLIELTQDQLSAKRGIVHELYGYGKDSLEFKACVPLEAFRRAKESAKEAER